jgi:voltage-gated sodium channel
VAQDQIDFASVGHRARLQAFLERDSVRNAIMGVIIFNAVTLGLATSQSISARIGHLLDLVDNVVIAIFVVELSLKMYAYGPRFFLRAWNLFDLVVVGISLVPDTQSLSALRGLRVLRVLRLLSPIPQVRAVVQSLIDALPGMGAIIVMLAIVYYIFAVMATMMFGADYPQWFGTLGNSFFSLFQVMTLEGWPDIARSVMETHPFAWLFFVPFIIATAFSVLNLFIGLLVNTMQSAVEQETEAELEKLSALVRKETNELDAHISVLQEELRALRQELREARETPDG